ncbi:MAG: GNAT family N-acetyltransferase [Sphingomonas sp.]|uniref:GNAT family N-acetyltransferase n=1 Tax=Sphingomonas sp. TaxID=28214 RepID=UPI003F8059E0
MIRQATKADRDVVATTLARAFADDPATSYIFPDRGDRVKRLPRMFRLIFDEDVGGMPLLTGSGEAATLWRKPGLAEIGKLEMLRQLFPLIGAFGSALGRAMRVGDAIDAHHPPGPYWYLHIAGVDPAHQGKGLGSASIRQGLARAREDGLPAFLETATPRNVSLYQSLGFEVIDEWHVPKGGPKFWSMLNSRP